MSSPAALNSEGLRAADLVRRAIPIIREERNSLFDGHQLHGELLILDQADENAKAAIWEMDTWIAEAESYLSALPAPSAVAGDGLVETRPNWSGWRSIDTAPEDERVILATAGNWVGEAIMLRNEFTGEQDWTWVDTGKPTRHSLYGWQPLPSPLSAPVLSDLRDGGFSLATTRTAFEHRAAVVAADRPALLAGLRALAEGGRAANVVRGTVTDGRLAFLFPGQGFQRVGMGRRLHDAFPAFAEAFDAVCAELDAYLERPLREVVWAEGGTDTAALLDQTWDYFVDRFPAGRVWNSDCNAADLNRIDIPLAPVIEVTGVFYTDTTGTEQEFDAANYVLDAAANPPRLTLASGASWPSPGPVASAVRIRVRAGHLDNSSPPVANVPAAVKAAIKILVGDFYDNRGSFVVGQTVSQFPRAVEWLLQKANNSRGFA